MKNLYNALLLKQLYLLKNLGYNYTNSAVCTIDTKTKLTLPNDLESLKQQAAKCHLCELSKSRKKVVFGEGNPNATLMFIAEAPSVAEDTSGRPFSGRTGEKLEEMIVNVLGLKKSEVYITNIIKCRPPNNRTPLAMEVNSCYPYLQKQIELISPMVIVTLGELAYTHLTSDDTPLAQVRGTVISYGPYTIVPTYHPSYVIRNPSVRNDVFIDLKKIKRLLEETPQGV